MPAPLLATKLYIPPVRPHLVLRSRLLEQLNTGLHESRRLTLISAPAGFGKTTLLSAWISSSDLPCAWLSLDGADNDPIQFLSYLIAAFQQVDQEMGQAVLPLLSAVSPLPQAVLTGLINDAVRHSEPLALVLDDYHLITEPIVHEMLGFLLENQPPSLHLIIGTREDPPLPLPRLRARGQITEIRQRDLRFTLDETQDFLSATMHLSLPEKSVSALQGRTEGWVTGLQLAALALQNTPEQAEHFIDAFAGDDRYVMDYLLGEVLERVPDDVRSFLHQTAILDRFTAALCDAVTGRDDSRAVLDVLEASNLFAIPLDNRREWYRYHHLFSDMLQLSLDAHLRGELYWRAAQWHWSQGLHEPAIQYGLASARITGSYREVEAWIVETAMQTLATGALSTLQGWLDALPAANLHSNPDLMIIKGWAAFTSGNLPLAESAISSIQPAVQDAASGGLIRAKFLLLSGMVALMVRQDYDTAIHQADQALQALPADLPYWRLIGLYIKAEASERMGPMTSAIEAFRAAQTAGQSVGNHVFLVTVELALANALHLNVQRHQAMRVCEEAIARYTDHLGRVAPIAAILLSVLGTLHYEANQLELARASHDQALAFSKQLSLDTYLSPSYGWRAPTSFALGEVDDALRELEMAVELAGEPAPIELGWLHARKADFRLRMGDRAFAHQWSQAAGLSPEREPHYLETDAYLVYARLLIANHDLDNADRLLRNLRAFLEQHAMRRPLLTTTILEAHLAILQGERSAALELMKEAVAIAAPEEYYRAFLDEDPRMLDLVREVRQTAPSFVDQLLAYGFGSALPPKSTGQGLIEPLSDRELEVLALMAAGYSNAEIADHLFIAVGTVKRHINNMFGKLAVESRTQAIAKGRSLRLLETDIP